MKKWIFVVLLIIPQLVQANSCEYTDESFSQWMMGYFRAPEPNKLGCSLSYYANSALFEMHHDGRMPAAHFYAYALKEEEMVSVFEKLAAESTLNEQMFLLHVLWIKNSRKSKELLEKASMVWPDPLITDMVKRMGSSTPRNLMQEQPDSAVALDNLWAVFFATGNADAVRQISKVLPLKHGSGMEIIIGGAASWSLIANARTYPEVKAIIKQLLKNAQGEEKVILEEVLENAASENT